MLKPSRKDLHRKLIDMAGLTQKKIITGYLNTRQMTELIVYIEHLKKQLAVNNLLKDVNETDD